MEYQTYWGKTICDELVTRFHMITHQLQCNQQFVMFREHRMEQQHVKFHIRFIHWGFHSEFQYMKN